MASPFCRAPASAGISQADNTPKEWTGSAEAIPHHALTNRVSTFHITLIFLTNATPTANLQNAALDEVLLRTDAAGTSNYLSDALGSTVALADASGAYKPNTAMSLSDKQRHYRDCLRGRAEIGEVQMISPGIDETFTLIEWLVFRTTELILFSAASIKLIRDHLWK